MKTRLLIAFRCFLPFLLLFGGGGEKLWGQKKRFNKDYQLDVSHSTLALIPVLDEALIFTDSLLTEFYDEAASGQLRLVKPDLIRSMISEDERLSAVLGKVRSQEYSGKELKTFPPLTTLIEPADITYLRAKLNQAHLILLPTELQFQVGMGMTFGYARFRLYDLMTGALVFDCPMSFNVNTADSIAIKSLSTILIGETASYFKEQLLSD